MSCFESSCIVTKTWHSCFWPFLTFIDRYSEEMTGKQRERETGEGIRQRAVGRTRMLNWASVFDWILNHRSDWHTFSWLKPEYKMVFWQNAEQISTISFISIDW